MSIISDETSEFDEDGTLEGSSDYTSLSPYLSFDPAYLPSQPEYLFPYGPKRGWFEHAFYNIGTACIVGAAVGGCRGFYDGLNLTTFAGQTGRIQRTRILNHTIKQGAATSNTLGIIAFMYCNLGVLLSFFRNADDELNSIAAATLTGMLYKVQGGLRKCGIGAATGFGLASLYYLCTSYEKLQVVKDQLQLDYSSNTQDPATDYTDK